MPEGTEPTQDPKGLVNAQHVKMLVETRGGFDADEVVRRPILVWTDQKGELGPKGRRYVIDGHHRAYMGKQAGASQLPGVEVFGDLAYAKSQARVSNLAGVPNTYSEQARIAKELLDRGDPISRVAAQIRTSVSKTKRMIDFAHIDPAVRQTYFAAGQEGDLLAVSFGETIGRFARESPEVMTVNMQEKWLNKAVDEGMRHEIFHETVKQWHNRIKAARQEIIEIGGQIRTKLSMTPKQFADTSGRFISALDAKTREIKKLTEGLELVSERAKEAGHAEAQKFSEQQLKEVELEGRELLKQKKVVDEMIAEAVRKGMTGEKDLATSFDEIQAHVDKVIGPRQFKSILGKDGIIRARKSDFYKAIRDARRRVRGIERRDPVVKQVAQGGPPPGGPVEKILAALKAAKPIRRKQKMMLTKERIRRIRKSVGREKGLTGDAWLNARLRSMKGKYQKAHFESIRKALTQEDVDALVNMIKVHPGLRFFEKANAGIALRKLLGEAGGQVPQKSELQLLEIVYGPELVNALTRLRPLLSKWKELALAIPNVTRTLRTSFDLSAPFRQGLYFGPRHPVKWARAWVRMHNFWLSEQDFKDGMNEIYTDPDFKLARKAGLAITSASNVGLNEKEEAFLATKLLEKIPLVKRSERAYVGFLNKLRMDVFKGLVQLAIANGRDPSSEPELARGIASFVNAGTGRGGGESHKAFLTKHAPLLNTIFFSPRFQASRLHLQNPRNYVQADPFLRRQYIESSLALAGAATMVLTLAGFAGARVEWERMNADWGKIRVGASVYDVLGGFVQYLRLWPTIFEALVNQAQGKRLRYGTALDVISRFTEHKLAPFASFVTGYLRGKATEDDIAGPRGSFQIGPELLRTFVPMFGEDVFEVMKKDPRQLPAAVPASLYGTSVSTYPPPRGGH